MPSAHRFFIAFKICRTETRSDVISKKKNYGKQGILGSGPSRHKTQECQPFKQTELKQTGTNNGILAQLEGAIPWESNA